MERFRQSLIRAIDDLDGKIVRIRDLETANAQLTSRSHDADDARRMAEAREQEWVRKEKTATQTLEDYKAANPPCNHDEFKVPLQQGRSDSPSKPRRKAQRSDRTDLQISPSRRLSNSMSTHPATPQRYPLMPGSPANDDDDLIGDIANMFPPTPELSSQALRPTVKFVADSMGSTILGDYSQHSQFRDHLGDDYLPSDYETLSQDEDTKSMSQSMSQGSQKGKASSTQPTTYGRQLPGLARLPRTLPDSQPSSQRRALQDLQPSSHRGPPKSILKSTNKRTAESAGLAVAPTRDSRRRSNRIESQELGPVVPDSQSQVGHVSQTRTHRSSRTKTDKSKSECMTVTSSNRANSSSGQVHPPLFPRARPGFTMIHPKRQRSAI